MKAVVQTALGSPSVLKYVTDWPVPVRQPGEALVRVQAAGVNLVDLQIRQGRVPTRRDVPKILGADMAGIVADVDESSQFSPGDRVFAHAGIGAQEKGVYKFAGSYSEYITVTDDLLAPVPPSVSLTQAAAIPLAGMTAWQSFPHDRLKAGQRVLIHGGAGGVGHFAVQIAKAKGLHVTATCSTRNINFVKALGADEVIDYTCQDFVSLTKDSPFDVVVDTIGGPVELASLGVTKRDGYFANVFNSGWLKYHKSNNALAVATVLGILAYQKALRRVGLGPDYKLVVLEPNGDDLRALANLMAQGLLRAHIDRTFPLDEAELAHEYLDHGGHRGKVVLIVGKEDTTV